MNSMIRWLKTAVLSGWSFVVLVLLVAWVLPYQFPQWSAHVTQFVSAHPLFVGILLLALFYLGLWKLPQRYVSTVPDEKDRVDLEWKARQTMAQLIGGAILLSGLFFTAKTLQLSQQTLQTSQEGQITDRFAKAVAQLGEDKLIVRLGGIYSLSRIAKDSAEKDSQTVMDVLTAFVREHAPLKKQLEAGPHELVQTRKFQTRYGPPPPDIQAILAVIKKRTPGQIWDIDLRNTDLQEAEIWGADFLRANFQRANLRAVRFFSALLRGTFFQGANLAGADLMMASLYGSNFEGANLEGANLQAAILDTPDLVSPSDSTFKKLFPDFFSPQMEQLTADLRRAHLDRTNLKGANLKRADLRNARLQKVINLTQEQVNEACVDQNTDLPAQLQKPQPCRDLAD
jgi:uncharacterized protein YjbI with pentapeptide repeats